MSDSVPARRRAAQARREPVQEFFSIGEVCELTELRPHVLRYWETQFRVLSPAKNRSGNRVYARREVEVILLVKQLLYTDKYTIDGARQRLDAQRKSGELRAAARAALERETTGAIERELRCIVDVLEGRLPPGGGRAEAVLRQGSDVASMQGQGTADTHDARPPEARAPAPPPAGAPAGAGG